MLVVTFALSFTAIAAATTALLAFAAYFFVGHTLSASAGFSAWALEHITLLGVVLLGTLALMLLASLYRAASLAGGGGQVAQMLGGSEVPADAADLARRRLLNVVEEMAIASGVPRPEIYVLERENGINAFAAGKTQADAAIAVTRGALERLDRTELQGVVAHELSHIVHGDMRLNQQLIGLSFGILVLSLLGRWLLRGARLGRLGRRRGRASGGTAAAVGLGVGFVLIGSIGLFATRLIKAAVSRERERLADASAVQFTRDASGLASALKKIAGFGGRLNAVETEEVAHMLFEHHGATFRGAFATHPPLVERIRALEPGFDPQSLGRLDLGGARLGESALGAQGHGAAALHPAAGALGLSDGTASPRRARHGEPGVAPEDAPAHAGASLLDRAGEVGSAALGAQLRAALPAAIYDAAHSRDTSMLLVLALVLAPDTRARAAQKALLEAQLGARRAARCAELRAELDRLDPALHIPIVELAAPTLKQRPAEQLDYLFELARKLADCGGDQRLFDYVLLRMLAVFVGAPAQRPPGRRTTLSAQAACTTLLAVVAAYGHNDTATALDAFHAGCAALGGNTLPEPVPPLESMRDLLRLDAALERLAQLKPRAKRRVLEALLATIRHDKHVGTEELELFRAVAATLGCPLPWDLGMRKRWRQRPALTEAAEVRRAQAVD